MPTDFKLVFIQKVLGEYLSDVQGTMAGQIRRQATDTGALLQSLHSRMQGSAESPTGELLFHEYGRMLDMGVGRGHPLGGIKKVRVALQASRHVGTAQVKDKTIRRKNIYSRIAYGKLNYLENQLLYGYTEETIKNLKEELNKANT